MIHVISTPRAINFKQRIYWLYKIETKQMKLLARLPNTKFNLNPLWSFGGKIYSFVKIFCQPTEPPKYSTRTERNPGTIMTEENNVKSIETIKNNLCEYKLPAEKLHQLIIRRAMRIRDVEPKNGSNLMRHTINWLADNFIIVETNTGPTLETDTLGGWLLDSSKTQNADLQWENHKMLSFHSCRLQWRDGGQ